MSSFPRQSPEALHPSNTSLLYLAPGDVLKGRVEPTIWMRMCQAYGDLGLDVELVSLYTHRSENVARNEIFRHYGIDQPGFNLSILPTPFFGDSPLWWYRGWTAALNLAHGFIRSSVRRERHRPNLVFYARGPAAMYPYLLLRPLFARKTRTSYFVETHSFLLGKGSQKVLRAMDGIVVSSKKLAHDMEAGLGIPRENLQVAYLASNSNASGLNQAQARCRLGLSQDKRYITYTGKLVLSELRLILEAAKTVQSAMPDVEFLFVGGNPKILPLCREEADQRSLKNVRFTGFISPAEVAAYQEASDILIVYLVNDRNIIDYITPSKIFDYLRAGRPIVLSDYPILHEILEDGVNALFVKPHAPAELASALQRVLSDPLLAEHLASNALRSSLNYSWEKRVQRIWSFIQRRSSAADSAGGPGLPSLNLSEVH